MRTNLKTTSIHQITQLAIKSLKIAIKTEVFVQ